jgi:hypothetical protein
LTGHTVSTAAHEGWDRLQNGELLNAAEEAGFDVLLTADKGISGKIWEVDRMTRLDTYIDWAGCELVERTPGKVSGRPVVRGYRRSKPSL